MRNGKECEGVVGSVRVHAPLLPVCVYVHLPCLVAAWVGWEQEQGCQKHANIHNDVTVEALLHSEVRAREQR